MKTFSANFRHRVFDAIAGLATRVMPGHARASTHSKNLLYFCDVKKFLSYLTAVIVAALLLGTEARGQNGGFLPFVVTEAGDTVYYDNIRPSYVYVGKKKGSKWRKYYRLVNNFSKVYPYALLAKEIMSETDSTFDAKDMGAFRKNVYVSKLEKKLFKAYEKRIRNMTVSQGQLMLRLIDRETGQPPYTLIKLYKSSVAAGFWQGVGKLFGADLKRKYEPDGIDRETEELVLMWQRGEFEGFYYSIFGKLPDIPDLGLKHKYGLPSIQESSSSISAPEDKVAR